MMFSLNELRQRAIGPLKYPPGGRFDEMKRGIRAAGQAAGYGSENATR